MKYIELILEETENGFEYREIKIDGDREERKTKVLSCPGRFFLYYDDSKKEEGKKLLYNHTIKEISRITKKYNFLLNSLLKDKEK